MYFSDKIHFNLFRLNYIVLNLEKLTPLLSLVVETKRITV
jgi:hypothetical protein